MTRLDSGSPARPLRPGNRGIRGRVVGPAGAAAGHESLLERDWLRSLAFDKRVRSILEQPFSLYHEVDGQRRRYTPDVQVEFEENGRLWTVVYEVKFREDLMTNWTFYRPRFKAATSYCRARGWRFKLITEEQIRGPHLKNLHFLRRYANAKAQPLHEAALMQGLRILGPTTPKALIAAAWYDQERQMAALAELWRLVAAGRISALLDQPLTMISRIWTEE